MMQLNLTSELLMDNQNHRNCLTPKLGVNCFDVYFEKRRESRHFFIRYIAPIVLLISYSLLSINYSKLNLLAIQLQL